MTGDAQGPTAARPATPEPSDMAEPRRSHAARLLRWVGIGLLALGTVGIFVPLLPTTIFWILAAVCFGRSDPRLQAWIFSHHRFGPGVEAFVRRGVLSRRMKVAAVIGILTSFTISAFLVADMRVRFFVGGILACVILYVVTRPEE